MTWVAGLTDLLGLARVAYFVLFLPFNIWFVGIGLLNLFWFDFYGFITVSWRTKVEPGQSYILWSQY